MHARVKTYLTGPILTAITLILSGCAGSSDFTVPMPDLSLALPAEEQLADTAIAVSETVAYGEPQIVPAGFGGGPQAVADSDGPYLLDTGDKLRVFVYGQPNLSRGYTVDHEGNITVPLIGTVHARGLTTRDLEASITAKLGSEFVRDPQVTVDVQQNRPFFIHGEVKTAGQYPYVSGMTVETAVAIAGGLSERGSARKFRISRRTNGFVEQIIAPADYVIKPGDTVFVYERFF
jgi:polysaccharide export outer membrane protein